MDWSNVLVWLGCDSRAGKRKKKGGESRPTTSSKVMKMKNRLCQALASCDLNRPSFSSQRNSPRLQVRSLLKRRLKSESLALRTKPFIPTSDFYLRVCDSLSLSSFTNNTVILTLLSTSHLPHYHTRKLLLRLSSSPDSLAGVLSHCLQAASLQSGLGFVGLNSSRAYYYFTSSYCVTEAE